MYIDCIIWGSYTWADLYKADRETKTVRANKWPGQLGLLPAVALVLLAKAEQGFGSHQSQAYHQAVCTFCWDNSLSLSKKKTHKNPFNTWNFLTEGLLKWITYIKILITISIFFVPPSPVHLKYPSIYSEGQYCWIKIPNCSLHLGVQVL